MLLAPVVSCRLPLSQRAESAAQPAFGSAKDNELSVMRALPACAHPHLGFSEPSQTSPCLQTLRLSFAEIPGKDRKEQGNDHVRPGQQKGLYSGAAQPAAPGKGRVCGLSRKRPHAGPGRALCGALLIPALLPKVQDHLHHSTDLCSQTCRLIPQLLHLLGLFPPQSERVPAVSRKADLVRELPGPAQRLQAGQEQRQRCWSPLFFRQFASASFPLQV